MRTLQLLGVFSLGVALGVALMAMLDPVSGSRRRSLARDRALHGASQAGDAVGRRARYERGHMRGVVHDVAQRAHLTEADLPADFEETLVDKIRSEGFRDSREELTKINLTAINGVVHVYGGADDRRQADDILRRVRSVHGVKAVVDHLVLSVPDESYGH